MGKFTQFVHTQVLASKQAHRYKRDQFNTFMTTFEWYNVEMAVFVDHHLKRGNTLFSFPYFSQLYSLLKTTYQSIAAARRYDSLPKIVFSEYGVTAGFINTFTALEYIPKGLLSLALYPFINKTNPTEMQPHFAKYYETYASNLETIAFYNHDYKAMREALQLGFSQTTHVSMLDYFTYKYIIGETHLRSWLSVPLQKIYNDPNNLVPATTDMIVKFKSNTDDIKAAEQEFIDKIAKIKAVAKVELIENEAKVPHIYIKKDHEKHTVSVYGLLAGPRYRDFIKTVKVLDEEKIQIKKIAGNDSIQIKCLVDANDEKVKTLNPLYTYPYDTDKPSRRMCLFDIPVKKLQAKVAELDKDTEIKINFIHNF